MSVNDGNYQSFSEKDSTKDFHANANAFKCELVTWKKNFAVKVQRVTAKLQQLQSRQFLKVLEVIIGGLPRDMLQAL